MPRYCPVEVSERGARRDKEKIFEEIMAENFPKYSEKLKLYTQGV